LTFYAKASISAVGRCFARAAAAPDTLPIKTNAPLGAVGRCRARSRARRNAFSVDASTPLRTVCGCIARAATRLAARASHYGTLTRRNADVYEEEMNTAVDVDGLTDAMTVADPVDFDVETLIEQSVVLSVAETEMSET